MKKKVIRFISAITAVVMCWGVNVAGYSDEDHNEEELTTNQIQEMDVEEAILTSYYYVGDIVNELVGEGIVYVDEPIPLYDVDENIVAYYVKFSPDSYAIVNNNRDNPAAIEFGEGSNEVIDALLESKSDSKVVYNQPGSIYELEEINKLSLAKIPSLWDFYPDLTVKNESLATWLYFAKDEVDSDNVFTVSRGNGNYGFFNSSDMPSGSYSSSSVTHASLVDWAVMSDYNSIASDHCGAVAVTNLALYYATRGFTNLKVYNSKYYTFTSVHAIVGNGPVYSVDSDAKTFFSNRGYTLHSSSVGTASDIVTAVSENRPCLTLLADGLVSWHWIVTVGWREYTSSGDFYMRVCDGWNNTINRYYKLNSGSSWVTSKRYWVTV